LFFALKSGNVNIPEHINPQRNHLQFPENTYRVAQKKQDTKIIIILQVTNKFNIKRKTKRE